MPRSEYPLKEPRTDTHSQSGEDAGSREIFSILPSKCYSWFSPFVRNFSQPRDLREKTFTIQTQYSG
jgi:hypothetical protein